MDHESTTRSRGQCTCSRANRIGRPPAGWSHLLINAIVSRIVETLPTDRRALVAVDGIGASGKTTFAEALAQTIKGRPVVLLHVDDYFNPSAIRYARGRYSAEGFWLDSYNYSALTSFALDPLGVNGDGWYRSRSIDHRTGEQITPEPRPAAGDALVLVEGTFLHRDELAEHWDASVFLDVPFAVAAQRMAARAGAMPTDELLRRYCGAQQIYFQRARPWERATLVVDNTDLGDPRVIAASAACAGSSAAW